MEAYQEMRAYSGKDASLELEGIRERGRGGRGYKYENEKEVKKTRLTGSVGPEERIGTGLDPVEFFDHGGGKF